MIESMQVDEGDKALPMIHNFQTNKNKMRILKANPGAQSSEEEMKSHVNPQKKLSKKNEIVGLDDDDLLDSEDDKDSSDSLGSLGSDDENVLKIAKPKAAQKAPILDDDLGYLDDLLDDDDGGGTGKDEIEDDDDEANIVKKNI